MPYVDAARAAGFGHGRIILRHMLPNVMAPYLIMLTAFLGQAILLESSLSFLGLGVQEPTAAWGLFYAEQRVRPFVRRALDRGHLDAAAARVVDRVCDRLASGDLDDERPPARIHGDLWSGNVLFTTDGAVLIDPAAHGGHGLTDLAMLALFGCPGLDRVGGAYEEAAGLAPGWRELVPLHQLHPLAVHAASHGPSYAAPLVEAARAFA